MRLLVLFFASVGSLLAGELQLSRAFGSHMVMPMNREITLSGSGGVNQPIDVELGGKHFRTVSDGSGGWSLKLPAMKASSNPMRIEVTCGGDHLTLEDVLVGEVWLCSGQSNMDFPLSRSIGGDKEVPAANHPQLRFMNLSTVPTGARLYDEATLERLKGNRAFQGNWQVCTPGTAASFSAVAYHTGKILQDARKVPIGLIENAVGGSGTEAWLPMEALKSRPDYAPLISQEWIDSERVSSWARERARQNLGPHLEANHPFKPGFLFESGVRPLRNFPFAGVIWYQGETNAQIHDDDWNGQLIRDLITGWRTALDLPDLSFYLVQLPRIGGNDPLRQFWPAYREVQAKAVKSSPHTHLVVTQDLGWDSPDVHPPDKLPIARRVAEAILQTSN